MKSAVAQVGCAVTALMALAIALVEWAGIYLAWNVLAPPFGGHMMSWEQAAAVLFLINLFLVILGAIGKALRGK